MSKELVRKRDVAGTLSGEDLKRALDIIEGIAEGDKLAALTGGPGQPKRGTFFRWLAIYPELKRAFDAAREISAYGFEDKALDMADDLINPNLFNGTKVRMYEVAMGQLRWSAARRAPTAFGEKATVQTVIPIQINTSMDIGQPGGGTKVIDDNVYSFAAEVRASEPEALPAPTPSLPDIPLTGGLKADIPRGKPGRPLKGHKKTPAQEKASATHYARKAQAHGRDHGTGERGAVVGDRKQADGGSD